MKVCSKCKIEKDLVFFGTLKRSKDGKRTSCRDCEKNYRDCRKDIKSEYDRFRYELNSDSIKERVSIYQKENRVDRSNYIRKWYYENIDDRRQKIAKYVRVRKSIDDLFNLKVNIRTMIYKSLLNNGYTKKAKCYEILGCSFEEFKIYLESKFEPWMNWQNKGLYNGELDYGWDIDHIIPLSSSKNEEEMIKLNHYTNLQPLCSKVNRDIKKDKLEYGNF